MTHDYNTAGEQKSFDVIPKDTIAVIQMNVRPGNAGEGGIEKRSKNGDAQGLDTVFTVVEGKYAKRKFFSFMITAGTTDGHEQARDITVRRLRAILESARGVKPTDVSESAKKARVTESFEDFDGLRFMAKIGVEPAQGDYKAKNILSEVVTPDRAEWHPIEQDPAAKSAAGTAAPAGNVTPIAKPAWAS
jgi:hypothetical protein